MSSRRRMMLGVTDDGGGDDPNPYANQYFTFTAVERTRFRQQNTGLVLYEGDCLYYSLDDGETWTDMGYNTYTPYIEIGDSIMLKTNYGYVSSSNNAGPRFSSDGAFDVSGNIMSLCYGSRFKGKKTIPYEYQFYAMFLMTKVRDASNLVLPATTLTPHCYDTMFFYSSLTSAPVLPAETLVESCYSQMFAHCTPLNHIECYATDISASNCTYRWVNNVSASGTFVKAPTMTSWTTGVDGIPSGWTVTNKE